MFKPLRTIYKDEAFITKISQFGYEFGNADGGICLLVSITQSPKKVENAIDVFPNPTIDFIITKSDLTEKQNWELYDSDGKIVRSIQFPGRKQVSIRDLSSGIYFWKTKNDDGKLIIR